MVYFINHQQQYVNVSSYYTHPNHQLAILSDDTSTSATGLVLLSHCVSLSFFLWIPFPFIKTFLLINKMYLSFEAWTVECHLPSCLVFPNLWFLLFYGIAWATYITNNILKRLVMQTFVDVPSIPSWSHASWVMNDKIFIKKLLTVYVQKHWQEGEIEKRRMAVSKLFGLHVNAKNNI